MLRFACIISAVILCGQIGPDEPETPRVQWWMFTADWCVPCKHAKSDFRPHFERMKPKPLVVSIFEDADIRLVDIKLEEEMVAEWGDEWGKVKTVPQFVLLVDGEPIERHYRYPGKERMQDAYFAAIKSLQPKRTEARK